MVIRIGERRQSEGPADPIDMLLDCHKRIRDFTALAVRLGERPDAPDEQLIDAANRLLSYFTLALPLHSTDEDESLFPRLRAAASADRNVLDALGMLSAQHEALHSVVGELTPAWKQVAQAPSSLRDHVNVVVPATTHMEELWKVHLRIEEEVIFPRVRALLGPDALQAIVGEMRARRELAFGVGAHARARSVAPDAASGPTCEGDDHTKQG
jgi:hemerythrin-like domain-containing protein